MTHVDLPPSLLKRKAVVYVRQSTPAQVQFNRESQRRQYELVEEARRRGFRDVEVIDDDLGRSASGAVARPGFDKLVAWLCAGDVGAILCSNLLVVEPVGSDLAAHAEEHETDHFIGAERHRQGARRSGIGDPLRHGPVPCLCEHAPDAGECG